MYKVAEFECSNFKKVEAHNLRFKDINLLIGPNNSGKSSLLRALSFASKMLSASENGVSGFRAEVERLGGSGIPRRGAQNRDVSMRWLLEPVSNGFEQGLDYQICFHVGDELDDVYMRKETLKSALPTHNHDKPFNFFSRDEERDGEYVWLSSAQNIGQGNRRTKIPVRTDEPLLLQYEEIMAQNRNRPTDMENQFSRVKELRGYFSRFFSYSSCNFDFERVRELRRPNTGVTSLARDGANFVNLYGAATRTDQSFQSRYLSRIQTMMPELTEIRLKKELGVLGMELSFRDNTSFLLSEVSDGTIEALLLVLLLTLPEKLAPTVLALDEPEVNMHPAWQAQLAHVIQTSGCFRQCFISTHSSDFLDAFTEQFREGKVGIFVCGSKGHDTFEPLDPEKLEPELEKGWLLGELYRVDDPLIGGWPL